MRIKYYIRVLYNKTASDLIIQIKHFKDNKQNGEYKVWHMNGSLIIICNYKNDKFDGEFIIYDENGNIQEHVYYKDDKMI